MTQTLFEAPRRCINRVFLHCSASEAAVHNAELVRLIRGWHENRGFNDIGYHFVIDRQGAILAGRPLDKTPAAQKGNNMNTIAICVHGLRFDDPWPVTAQAASVISLCGQIHQAYRGIVAFWPHNAVSNKACPVFDVDKLLGLDRWRRMQ